MKKFAYIKSVKEFSKNKIGQTEAIFDLSSKVTPIGFEPMALSLEG